MKQKKDIFEKKLMAYNDVFADIFNALILHDTGLKIDPDDLEDARTRSVYVPLSKEDNTAREQERDIAKFWKKEGVILCLIGLENQTAIDKFMPMRIMGYEGADYRFQITERDEALRTAKRKGDNEEVKRIRSRKFYPVITAVLYYGVKRRWNRHKTLCECLDIPDGLKNLVEDRHINVIELAWLNDEEHNRLKGDAWLLIDALRQIRMNGAYINKDLRTVEHVEAMLMFLREISKNDNLFYEGLVKYENEHKEGRKVTMIDFAGAVYRGAIIEGIDQGRKEGILQGRKEGINQGRALERENSLNALKELGASKEFIEKYINLCNAKDDKNS